jgi:hypothetical protein
VYNTVGGEVKGWAEITFAFYLKGKGLETDTVKEGALECQSIVGHEEKGDLQYNIVENIEHTCCSTSTVIFLCANFYVSLRYKV